MSINENILSAEDKEVLAHWSEVLPQYPIWNCGGSDFGIEEFDGAYYFTACFDNSDDAQNAVKMYREILMRNGFSMAGECPSEENLYKTVNGKRCHADTEHCFDSDDCAPTVGFNVE